MENTDIHIQFGARTAKWFIHLLSADALVEWKTCLSFKRRLEILFENGATSEDLKRLMREWNAVQTQDEFDVEETTAVEVTELIWEVLNETPS